MKNENFQPQMTQIAADELNALSQRVIACAFAVHSELGNGFLEKVYENALCVELEKNGLKIERQKPLNVFYAGTLVGEFQADIVVENALILELKAVSALTDAHGAQCINYLKATGRPLCLLINFGEVRARVKRFINTKFSSAK